MLTQIGVTNLRMIGDRFCEVNGYDELVVQGGVQVATPAGRGFAVGVAAARSWRTLSAGGARIQRCYTAQKMRDVRSVDAAGRKFCPQNRYNQDDSQTSFSVQFLCLRPPHGDNAGLRGARRGNAGASKTAPDPPLLKNKPQPSSAVDKQRGHCAGGENEHPAACERLVTEAHWRPPVLAAFTGSHHQTVGKAPKPYSGIVSGWPKRSQRAVHHLRLVHCGIV